MKFMVASDIHGSAFWCRKLREMLERESPDKLILLGDLLYHGPRNPLPDEYAPKEVAAMLNDARELIVAVRGNCDSEVDQMVLAFPCMADYAIVLDEQARTIFCTHGHVHTPEAPPALPKGSVFLSGHTHVKTHEERDGILYVNPGSVSIPKDGSHSYAVYEDGAFALKTLS